MSDLFSIFWEAYPRKVAKKDAERAFKAAKITEKEMPVIMGALQNQKRNWHEARFIPYPATWIRGERWNDEPDPAIGKPRYSSTDPEEYLKRALERNERK